MMRTVVLMSVAGWVALGQPSVFNSASLTPAGLPNSGVASGSIISVFGDSIGPDSATQADGVSIQVTQGAAVLDAVTVYAGRNQVNAILPSGLSDGAATLTIRYAGRRTDVPVTVKNGAFGIYTQNSAGSGPAVATGSGWRLITAYEPARTGEVVTLWGTGVDAQNAEVYIGGARAQVMYAGPSGCCRGLDQINVTIPAGVEGCSVSVLVKTGGMISNVPSILISRDGGACSDANGLTREEWKALAAAEHPVVGIVRAGLVRTTVPPSMPYIGYLRSADVYTQFLGLDGAYLRASRVPFGMPSRGDCTVEYSPDYQAPIGPVADPVRPAVIDAGAVGYTLWDGQANMDGKLVADYRGYATAHLGTSFPAAGTVRLRGTGGEQTGSFDTTVTGFAEPKVTAPGWSDGTAVAGGTTVEWTGGPGDGFMQLMLDSGWARVRCSVEMGAGRFTFPERMLLALPERKAFLTWVAYGAAGRFAADGVTVGLAQGYYGWTDWAVVGW